MYEDLTASKQKIEQSRSDVIESQRRIPIVTKRGIFAHRGRPQQERLQRIEDKRHWEQLEKQEVDYTKQLREITQKMEDLRRRDERIIENNLIIREREDRRKKFPESNVKEKKLPKIPEVDPFVPTFFPTSKRKIVRMTKKRYRGYQ